MFALFDFQVVNCTLKELLIFWLPSYFFYSQSMRMLSSNIRSQKWSQIIDTTFAPSLVIPVLLETLHIRETKFKVTNKKKTTNNSRAVGYMIPHLVLVVLSVLAIIRFVHGKYGIALIYSAVIIYWLCHNLISLLYALAFMLGRYPALPHRPGKNAAAAFAVSGTSAHRKKHRCHLCGLCGAGIPVPGAAGNAAAAGAAPRQKAPDVGSSAPVSAHAAAQFFKLGGVAVPHQNGAGRHCEQV